MRKILAAVVATLPFTAGAAQPLPAGFGWFAELVGTCWVGRLPDGKTEHKHCYSAQFGKVMRGTAVLRAEKDGTGFTVFEGDSVYSWDAPNNRIAYAIWGSDGGIRLLHARYEGEALHFPLPARDPSKPGIRSVWRRVNADTIEVRRDRGQGDQWTPEFTVVYRREGA